MGLFQRALLPLQVLLMDPVVILKVSSAELPTPQVTAVWSRTLRMLMPEANRKRTRLWKPPRRQH